MVAAAVIGGVASIAGGVIASSGAKSAANTAAKAAADSNALSKAMYDQTRSDLLPYQATGQKNLADLQSQMSSLSAPFSMTQANLEQTPGYQFTMSQGLKAVNNAMGARGLLNSGAVMKGAANYATGLADSTYMDQFNMDQTQKQNTYNRLMGMAQLGENAAAQTGAYGTQTAANVAQTNTSTAQMIGNAQMSGANSIASGFQGVGNTLMANQLLHSMYGK